MKTVFAILVSVTCTVVVGCATRADVINVRETLWNGTAQIRARDLEQATTRPASEQAAIREVHKNLEEFVTQSRSHDSSWISKTP